MSSILQAHICCNLAVRGLFSQSLRQFCRPLFQLHSVLRYPGQFQLCVLVQELGGLHRVYKHGNANVGLAQSPARHKIQFPD